MDTLEYTDQIIPGDVFLFSTLSEANHYEYALKDMENASLPCKCFCLTDGDTEALKVTIKKQLPEDTDAVIKKAYAGMAGGLILIVSPMYMRAITTVLEVSGEQVSDIGLVLSGSGKVEYI